LENGRIDGKGGLSAKSVLNINRILKKALAHAVRMQVINRNPAEFVEVPKQKKYKASVLDEAQVQNMLAVFKETYIYIPVLLAAGLGLRRGEALGLRWQDIDIDNNSIAINQTLLMTKGGIVYHDPKTETSKRVIIVPTTIMEELRQHKGKQDKVKRIMGKAYQDNDLVSCYDDGHPFNPSTFSGLFGDISKRNKLPQIRFHDLRHTNATIMLKHNIPAKVASERLGHSTIGITLDLYSHVLKEMQEEAASKIDNALFNNGGHDDI
jgi:integrase